MRKKERLAKKREKALALKMLRWERRGIWKKFNKAFREHYGPLMANVYGASNPVLQCLKDYTNFGVGYLDVGYLDIDWSKKE